MCVKGRENHSELAFIVTPHLPCMVPSTRAHNIVAMTPHHHPIDKDPPLNIAVPIGVQIDQIEHTFV